jgi:putative intracellular protease/amidase
MFGFDPRYHNFQRTLKDRGAKLVDKPVEEDGGIITGRDSKAAGELVKKLLERLSPQ